MNSSSKNLNPYAQINTERFFYMNSYKKNPSTPSSNPPAKPPPPSEVSVANLVKKPLRQKNKLSAVCKASHYLCNFCSFPWQIFHRRKKP